MILLVIKSGLKIHSIITQSLYFPYLTRKETKEIQFGNLTVLLKGYMPFRFGDN